jgi:hypothetical protein
MTSHGSAALTESLSTHKKRSGVRRRKNQAPRRFIMRLFSVESPPECQIRINHKGTKDTKEKAKNAIEAGSFQHFLLGVLAVGGGGLTAIAFLGFP